MAQSRQPTIKRCCLLYPWCVFLFLLLLGFIAFISVLFWTSWRPMKPTYTITDLSIPALNILQGTQKTNTTISFTIEVLNPNRAFSIQFHYINVTVSYGAQHIANTTAIADISKLKPTESNSKVTGFPAYPPFWQNIGKLIADGKVELGVCLNTKFEYQFLTLYKKVEDAVLYGRVPVGKDGKILEDKKINLNPR